MIGQWRTAFVSALGLGAVVLGTAVPASAAQLYFNGFETDIAGWDFFSSGLHPTRVGSGSNGITSATGSFHAEFSSLGSAGDWGGYNFGAGDNVATAFQEYKTSIDIYLDIGGGWANNTRFDFDSAINNAAGNFLRDFIFNAGFYTASDVTGPGAGSDRFVISASNNSQPGSAYAKNPDKDPIAITDSGWYTFMHRFYEQAGKLAVDMTIMDSSSTLVNSWTILSGDAIGGVGGNRYAWFDYNQFSTLAFDNASLATAEVPEPATLVLLGLGLAGLGAARRRRAV